MSSTLNARVAFQQLEGFRDTLDEIRATSDGPLIGCNGPSAALVVEAIHASGLLRKVFVQNCEAQRSTVYSALNGVGGLPIGWLWGQPQEFWQAYWPLVAKAKLPVRESRKAAMHKVVDALQELALLPEEEQG